MTYKTSLQKHNLTDNEIPTACRKCMTAQSIVIKGRKEKNPKWHCPICPFR